MTGVLRRARGRIALTCGALKPPSRAPQVSDSPATSAGWWGVRDDDDKVRPPASAAVSMWAGFSHSGQAIPYPRSSAAEIVRSRRPVCCTKRANSRLAVASESAAGESGTVDDDGP